MPNDNVVPIDADDVREVWVAGDGEPMDVTGFWVGKVEFETEGGTVATDQLWASWKCGDKRYCCPMGAIRKLSVEDEA